MAKKRQKKPEDRSTVRAYPHFEELRDCLSSGWPATVAKDYLIERYGSEGVPHTKAITRWRDKHLDVAVRVLPHSVIATKLKGVQFKVDVIGHLSRLIALCEDRVGRGLDQEDKLFGGMPLAINDNVMQTYLHALAQYVQVAQDLGILKSRPQVPFIDARTMNISPEALVALRETVREIRLIEQGALTNGKETVDARHGRTEAGNQEDDPKADAV